MTRGQLVSRGAGRGSEEDDLLSANVSASFGHMVSGGRPLRPKSAWRPTTASSQTSPQIASILRPNLRGFHIAEHHKLT
jgi:hypothetical protein